MTFELLLRPGATIRSATCGGRKRRSLVMRFDFAHSVGDALFTGAGRSQSPRLFSSTSQVPLAVLSFLHNLSSGARLSSAMVIM